MWAAGGGVQLDSQALRLCWASRSSALHDTVPTKFCTHLWATHLQIAIIHTHGPKPETALCVADFIRAREVDVSANRDAVLAHIPDLIRDCRLQNMPWLDICLRLAASAVAADGGSMYQRVQRLHASLCPGVCWMPQEAGGHAVS